MAGIGKTFDDETAGTAAFLLSKLNKGPKPQGNIQQQQADSSQQAQPQPQPTSANHGPDPRTSTSEAGRAGVVGGSEGDREGARAVLQERPRESGRSEARAALQDRPREGGSSGARAALQDRPREGGSSGARAARQERPREGGNGGGARIGNQDRPRGGNGGGARIGNQDRPRDGNGGGARIGNQDRPRDGDGGGARIGNRAARVYPPRVSWLLKILLTMMAVLILLPAAIWCLTVDAPHSPQALSRPSVTRTLGGSRVTAVIAPFVSAATYSSYLYAFLARTLNATLPGILGPISPAGVANLTDSTDRLKREMLGDADARWRHLQEIDEYIFTDIESAWFFQRGDWGLQLRLFPRRAVYYASLWAGAPSPEPPMRTARRRVGELQAYLEYGVAANNALKWQAVAIRQGHLRVMEGAVGKYEAIIRRDGRADQPRDAKREQRDAEAATTVIHDLLTRAALNSSLADQQFTSEPDAFEAMVRELKQKKASLSQNDSAFEGSWGRVFESGARALEVLVRLEELAGALRWLLADVDEPQGKHG